MHKKTMTHKAIRTTNLWRNFFWLYSASLAALYIYLSLTDEPALDASSLTTDTYPAHKTTSASEPQLAAVRLADVSNDKNKPPTRTFQPE